MQGQSLRFYLQENQRHEGRLLYEWLLDAARGNGIRGGCAFKAMAGYGRHHRLHEARFFELAGEQTVLVEFIVDAQEAGTLLALAESTGLPLFWTRQWVEFGVLGEA
jgi:PII-like signaling protein